MELDSEDHKLIDDARNSISTFCIEECNAYCCRKGYLLMTPDQHKEVTRKKDLGKRVSLLADGRTVLNLSPACPSLDGTKCSIYDSKTRPPACHEFPIFVEDESISFSPRCLAVKEKRLYAVISQLKRKGHEVTFPNL